MTKAQHTMYLSVRDRMRQMIDLPNAEIAARLKCSIKTVENNRRQIEGPTRPAREGNWSMERVERLKQLWDAGYSASRVAAMLGGFTGYHDGGRSAVIGKVHRLGLPGRITKDRVSTRRTEPRKPPTPVQPRPSPLKALRTDGLPIPTPAETDIPRVSFLALNEDGERHCKWPCVENVAGIPQDQPLYCGMEPILGLPYCRNHAIRAHSTPMPTRQSAASGVQSRAREYA